MGVHAHHISHAAKPDYARFERMKLSLRLPEEEEFACTSEDEREAIAVLCDSEDCGAIVDGALD